MPQCRSLVPVPVLVLAPLVPVLLLEVWAGLRSTRPLRRLRHVRTP